MMHQYAILPRAGIIHQTFSNVISYRVLEAFMNGEFSEISTFTDDDLLLLGKLSIDALQGEVMCVWFVYLL